MERQISGGSPASARLRSVAAVRRWARDARGHIRPTVRLRLALLSGALAVLAGVVALGLTYVLVSEPFRTPLAFFSCRGAGCPAPPGLTTIVHGTSSIPPLPAEVRKALATLRAGLPPSPPTGHFPGQVAFLLRTVSLSQRAVDLRQFLVRGGLALAVMAVLAAAAGWWVAGRVLRPLQVMTRRVRELSAQTPFGRIGLSGPDDELKALGDTFDALLGRLDVSLAAERRFVANASHELRTPLAIQETLLDVGLGDPKADVRSLREMAGRLQRVNRRSRRLIDGLLTLARSRQGLGRSEPVDLAAVARDAVEAVATEPAAPTLRIEQDLQPAPVRGDPVLLERLAGNLVENAVRYNASGGWVRIRTAVADRRATLTVANSGPLVPGEDVNGLFEPFRRGARDRTDSHRGAGLGLSIVRAVAETHEGTAVAEARPEGGLLVTVALPLADDARQVRPPDGAEPQGPGDGGGRGHVGPREV